MAIADLPISIIRYPTLRSCLKSFGLDDNSKGYWQWPDADGNKHRSQNGTAIKELKNRSCWGWVENKKIIHVWVGKRATLSDVVSLLSHEIGHLERPFHKNRFSEEQKASKYQRVAVKALKAAQDLLNDNNRT